MSLDYQAVILKKKSDLIKGFDSDLTQSIFEDLEEEAERMSQLLKDFPIKNLPPRARNHMIDLVKLGHYCSGATSIETGLSDSPLYTIREEKDLFWLLPKVYFLRRFPEDSKVTYDKDFTGIFGRVRTRNNENHGFPTESSFIQMVGALSGVEENIGKKVTADLIANTPIPEAYATFKQKKNGKD